MAESSERTGTTSEQSIDSRTIWKHLLPDWIPATVLPPSDHRAKFRIDVVLLDIKGNNINEIFCGRKPGVTWSIDNNVLLQINLDKDDKPCVETVKVAKTLEHQQAVQQFENTLLNKYISRVEQEINNEATARADEKMESERESIRITWEEYKANVDKHDANVIKHNANVEKDNASLKAEREQLDPLLSNLEGREAALEDKQRKFDEAGGPEMLERLRQIERPDADEAQPPERLEDKSIKTPISLIKSMVNYLGRQNYTVEEPLLLQTLLCLCVGAATGQFVVLTGPPGSGKTSLVQKIATAVGAGNGVVPVRPAWIDSTDLIGFYNPNMNRYQPTPFLDHVLEAEKYKELNRLYLLVLDEMNLGRIENYAADFLSLLEKARDGDKSAKLQLYSAEIKNRLDAELQEYDADDNRKKALQAHKLIYLNSLAIPENLVLFGTINVDETTHLPSPKFLDRSLTIQVSDTTLPKTPETTLNGEVEKKFSWALSLTMAQRCKEGELSDKAQTTWKTLFGWNTKYFKPLGIHLSHRLPQVYRCYMGAASMLKIPDDQHQQVADTFVLSKIMPLISFRESDVCETSDETKMVKLEEWKAETETAFPLVHTALKAMKPRYQIMRYLE